MKIKILFLGLLECFSLPILASSTAHNEWGTSDDINSLVALITSVLTFLGVIVTYWQFRRKQFTDTITKERLNFIKEWRECAARFCTLLSPEINKNADKENSLEYYFYKLLLLCDSTKSSSYMDIDVVNQVTHLYAERNHVNKDDIYRFLALMQANISLEWKGATKESSKGLLSEEEKDRIRQECYCSYQNWVNCYQINNNRDGNL